jgi:hypothetical protein
MNENDALRFLGAEINMMVDPNDPRQGRSKLDKNFLCWPHSWQACQTMGDEKSGQV